ncbi:MAG: MFS transporter, partial [Promethearchaeota archaeon]
METTKNLQLTTIVKNSDTFRQYIFFWIGQLVSLFGSSIVQFAFTWYLTSQSENAMLMGIFMVISFFPHIILSPVAGVVADKYDRKKLIIIADGSQAFVTLVLIILAPWLLSNMILFMILYAFRYIGNCFHYPVTS